MVEKQPHSWADRSQSQLEENIQHDFIVFFHSSLSFESSQSLVSASVSSTTVHLLLDSNKSFSQKTWLGLCVHYNQKVINTGHVVNQRASKLKSLTRPMMVEKVNCLFDQTLEHQKRERELSEFQCLWLIIAADRPSLQKLRFDRKSNEIYIIDRFCLMMQLLVFISVNVELIPIIRKFRKGFQVHICSKMNGFSCRTSRGREQ